VSIATKQGDSGQTGLVGGTRVSKCDARVECYGTVDELISQLGFARAICADEEIRERVKQIQCELFKVGSALATPHELAGWAPAITSAMVDRLGADVCRIEAMPGITTGWSLPGELPVASALDVARTVCRRAERLATRLMEIGQLENPVILAYLNRLSDFLWLAGRLTEARAGVDSSLHPQGETARGRDCPGDGGEQKSSSR
jgi:cob(I)alamin adenosyltransferase